MSSGNVSWLPIAAALGAVGVLADGKGRGLVHFVTGGGGPVVTAQSTSPVVAGVFPENVYGACSHVGIRLGDSGVVALTFPYFTTPGPAGFRQ